MLSSAFLLQLAKVIAAAVAIGLDVLAVSVGIGVAGVARRNSFRLGLAFAAAEISMQFIGYELGSGMGQLLGKLAAYVGFGLLAAVGVTMLRASRHVAKPKKFDAASGWGLLLISLSISLDSLAVGFALPAARIPLGELMIVVSITTVTFTALGLACGARLGERYEHRAEALAGLILIVLALLFSLGELFHG